MNTLIIYLSFYGNTASIADRIEKAIGKHARLLFFEDATGDEIKTANLVIVGSPTHKYYAPSHMREFLDAMPADAFYNQNFCVFDTHYNQPIARQGSATLEMSERISRRGGIQLLPPESFFMVHREGPLEKEEEKWAKEWRRQILKELSETTTT